MNLLLLFLFFLMVGRLPADGLKSLLPAVEANLRQEVLGVWFPACVDETRGGFHQNFAEDWTRLPGDERSVVFQARQTWTAAQAAAVFPDESTKWKQWSDHGLDFLWAKMWDAEQGGFYWQLEGNGQPARGGEKHVYGVAFGLYAAAANFAVTQRPEARQLARLSFRWLEEHAHDAQHGGYWETFSRDGKWLTAPAPGRPEKDPLGIPYGWKSMNSHIHLLEALAALYACDPTPQVAARLTEVLGVVRENIIVEPGCQHLLFSRDWRPLPDHDSYGHDVETAYLIVEASHVLTGKHDPAVWAQARRILDHALDCGWDREHGGFYDGGGVFGPVTKDEKIWWVQAEGLNALLLMHQHFGQATDRYRKAFGQQWDFIQKHQIDPQHRGWCAQVSREGTPKPGAAKGDGWTESYHQGRALLNVRRMLQEMGG